MFSEAADEIGDDIKFKDLETLEKDEVDEYGRKEIVGRLTEYGIKSSDIEDVVFARN